LYSAIHHTLERFNLSVRHAKPPIVMIDHGFPTPVFRVFQFLKNRSIEGLTDAEAAEETVMRTVVGAGRALVQIGGTYKG
jgi:hypothetical protein